MTSNARITALRYVMIATGIIFTFCIYPLTKLWTSGWSWGTGHSHYLLMILGVYATLGVCLMAASRDPLANRSLIWFTVWSSVVHAAVMAVEAIGDPAEAGHLVGDVPALLLVAGALAFLTPRGATVAAVKDIGSRRAA
ncbi:MAG: DUF6632 domain-containing protein [Gemmatimonadota bacterium]